MFITFFYNKHIIGHEQRTNEYFEPVHFSYVSDVWSSSTQHIWIHFYNACSIWSEAHKSMLDVGQCSWSPEITNTKMECPFYFLFAVSVFLVFSILFLLAFTRSLSLLLVFSCQRYGRAPIHSWFVSSSSARSEIEWTDIIVANTNAWHDNDYLLQSRAYFSPVNNIRLKINAEASGKYSINRNSSRTTAFCVLCFRKLLTIWRPNASTLRSRKTLANTENHLEKQYHRQFFPSI